MPVFHHLIHHLHNISIFHPDDFSSEELQQKQTSVLLLHKFGKNFRHTVLVPGLRILFLVIPWLVQTFMFPTGSTVITWTISWVFFYGHPQRKTLLSWILLLTTKCLKINEISIIVSCTLCSVLWLRKIWKSEANVELPWPCVLFKGQQGETHSKRVKTTLLLNSIYQHINSFLMSLWSLSLLSDHLHHSIHMIPFLQVNSKTIK